MCTGGDHDITVEKLFRYLDITVGLTCIRTLDFVLVHDAPD